MLHVYRGDREVETRCLGIGGARGAVFGGMEKCSSSNEAGDIQMFFECSSAETAQAVAAEAKPEKPHMLGCITDADCGPGTECWPNDHRCMAK